MRKGNLVGAAVAACVISSVAMADVNVTENTSVGGQFFLDFGNINEQQNGKDVPPSGTGFDIKRAYFIVNHTFNDIWSANLTADANYVNSAAGTGLSNSSTANSGGVTEFFVKYLYGQARFNDAFLIRFGSEASPWTPFIDGVTSLRWVEKSITDRLGFANTADWGVNALGTAANGFVSYSVGVFDGGGYKNPTRTKKVDVEGRLDVHPVSWLTVAGGFYEGHLGQVTAANDSFPQHTATRYDGLINFHNFGVNAGAEYFIANNYRTASASTGVLSGPVGVVIAGTNATTGLPTTAVEDKATGFSSWVSYDFTKQWAVFGRYDQADLSKDVDHGLRDKFADAGVIFRPTKGVDVGLVYKYEEVSHGTVSISSGDGNASYTIGGTGVAGTGTKTDGRFNEVGVYTQVKF
jgi:hypothetical protein